MMKTKSIHFLLVYPAISVVLSLAPSAAPAAWLPGWGSNDGTPGLTVSWCGTSGDQLHVGDFNGDGRTDLLCHSTTSGSRRIDYAHSTFRGFWGSNWWNLDDWCTDSGDQLKVGDFDGDGKSDLLCRVRDGYPNAGRKQIDFADGSGHFDGTDWDTLNEPNAPQSWCTNAGEQIRIGDFNGDNKDDLLCFVTGGYTNEGRKRIDYAGSGGTFFGTEWDSSAHPEVEQDWCTDAGESMLVGDFSGNGKDDLLCFVHRTYTNAGRRRVDFFGSTSEPFAGTDWTSASGGGAVASWCAQYGDELYIGALDESDNREDLLCANWDANTDGSIRVDIANSSGTFFGTNGSLHEEDWCKATTKNFYMGDFDGDGRDDVLCHDPSSGYRAIRYASADGDFFSVCSADSVLGDGELPALPVHFAVAANPSQSGVSRPGVPTATSTHDDPFDAVPPVDFTQNGAGTEYFLLEVDVMNARTYDNSGSYDSPTQVAVDDDVLLYEYESHFFYSSIGDTSSCEDVIKYSNPPSELYASNCDDGANCFPNSCGAGSWNGGFACAIRECTDPEIHKPNALNVVVMDRCNWDGGLTTDSCGGPTESIGFGPDNSASPNSWGVPDFFTAWDYERMLRGPDEPDRDLADGVEQHELGHVLNLWHTYTCGDPLTGMPQYTDLNENPMHKYPGSGPLCQGYADDHLETTVVPDREGGYHYDIDEWDGPQRQNLNQIETMVTTAREQVIYWSCN